MAVSQYYAWDRSGRPLNPAQPIRELVEQLRIAFPAAANAHLFSWYADDAHYMADFPQDHTPYSYTGWPLENPYPFVFATDVMHRPDLGVDCQALFDYWLAEAKAGRMPWLKYLIWQARLYHTSSGWQPQKSIGHHDHIHISARTDHQFTSLGSWSVVPVVAPPAAPSPVAAFIISQQEDTMAQPEFMFRSTRPELDAVFGAWGAGVRHVGKAEYDWWTAAGVKLITSDDQGEYDRLLAAARVAQGFIQTG